MFIWVFKNAFVCKFTINVEQKSFLGIVNKCYNNVYTVTFNRS